jgi:hypothetical protein
LLTRFLVANDLGWRLLSSILTTQQEFSQITGFVAQHFTNHRVAGHWGNNRVVVEVPFRVIRLKLTCPKTDHPSTEQIIGSRVRLILSGLFSAIDQPQQGGLKRHACEQPVAANLPRSIFRLKSMAAILHSPRIVRMSVSAVP